MESGQMSKAGTDTGSARSASKPRLSPELQELMHMLVSLEHHLARDSNDR